MNDETRVTTPEPWTREHGHNNLIGLCPADTIYNACRALEVLREITHECPDEEFTHGYWLLMNHVRNALMWENDRVQYKRIPEDEVARKKAEIERKRAENEEAAS